MFALKRIGGAVPVSVRMCTWEFVTTFDGHPTETQLQKQFQQDFPQEDVGKIQLNLMTSLNSAEGRRLRYLVIKPEDEPLQKRLMRRRIPWQSWLFGWADKNFPDADGNCLFWKVIEGTLFILVFFEGRLCHWSEEPGYGSPMINESMALVESRLERFRKFLENDVLFSRGEHFPEIMIDDSCEKSLFKRAAKDSFWKDVNLGNDGASFVLNDRTFQRNWLGNVLMVAVLLLVMLGCHKVVDYVGTYGSEKIQSQWMNVLPVELTMPALIESTELKVVEKHVAKRKPACDLPNVSLKGIVAPKLFLASVSESGGIDSFGVGDSLGTFVVREINRSQVLLACGDSSVVVSVR